jgi:hypothetical protein
MITTRHPWRLRFAPLAGLVCLVAIGVSGCASGTDSPQRIGAPATGLPAQALAPGASSSAVTPSGSLKIFLLTENGPWPVWRDIGRPADPQAALDALAEGPRDTERSRGISSALPTNTLGLTATASVGRVDIDLPWNIATIDHEAVSQLACTAASAPGIPGDPDATEVLVVFHEPIDPLDEFTVRCGTDADAKAETDS